MDLVKVFAPASIGNIGPGFDVLGMAIGGLGDTVEARRIDQRKVRIVEITGDGGQLPRQASLNTAGIAAKAVLRALKAPGGVELRLYKGIPGSGLGSSAASAVAAGFATNQLYGGKLSKSELILPCATAETRVSGGFFLDNVGASLMGGVVITRPSKMNVIPLGTIPKAIIIVVTPTYQLLTRKARKILPGKVRLEHVIANLSNACTLVAAVSRKDVKLFGAAVCDLLIEPVRAKLIPGFYAVKKAALSSGALGCSISGAGASVFSVTDNLKRGSKIGGAMQRAFSRYGLDSTVTVTRMDGKGARVIP
ncbi:MAG: homoserine kinase [Nitrospiria bacterium]